MAHRIVIEEAECIHGYRRTHHRLHAWLRGLVPCGPERRVLDPGSFECVDNVDQRDNGNFNPDRFRRAANP